MIKVVNTYQPGTTVQTLLTLMPHCQLSTAAGVVRRLGSTARPPTRPPTHPPTLRPFRFLRLLTCSTVLNSNKKYYSNSSIPLTYIITQKKSLPLTSSITQQQKQPAASKRYWILVLLILLKDTADKRHSILQAAYPWQTVLNISIINSRIPLTNSIENNSMTVLHSL